MTKDFYRLMFLLCACLIGMNKGYCSVKKIKVIYDTLYINDSQDIYMVQKMVHTTKKQKRDFPTIKSKSKQYRTFVIFNQSLTMRVRGRISFRVIGSYIVLRNENRLKTYRVKRFLKRNIDDDTVYREMFRLWYERYPIDYHPNY